jgi:WD40 repeat protein
MDSTANSDSSSGLFSLLGRRELLGGAVLGGLLAGCQQNKAEGGSAPAGSPGHAFGRPIKAAFVNTGLSNTWPAQGKATTFFDASELEVHALALVPGGGLYAGTSPDGKIYKIDPAGKSSVLFDPPDKYIWGLAVDKAGNVFSSGGAGPGIIRITSPEGKLLGTINLPIYGGEPKKQICATNEAFGGPDGKTLFIAGCDSVYTIQLKTAGIVPAYNVNK